MRVRACGAYGFRCRLMRSGGLLWKLLQLGCFSFTELSAWCERVPKGGACVENHSEKTPIVYC